MHALLYPPFVILIVGGALWSCVASTQNIISEYNKISNNGHRAHTQTIAAYLVTSIVAGKAGLTVDSAALPIDILRAQLQY
jgi:hypothetical protein